MKRKSEEFNNPVLLFPLKNNQDQSWPQTFNSFLNIVPQNVILAALKKEEWKEDNNYIIRFVEICGKASEVGIKFNSMICDKILNIESIDLLERNIQESFKWNSEERSLKFNINGFEIRSFKLNLY
ncbi:MAG: glycosyl hydrolase-related protein [Candidatus Lokiarchaeota archaeon]